MSIPRRCINWKVYDQFRAQFDGTKAASAPLVCSIDMDPRNFAQYKRTRHRDEPPAAVNGADDTNVDIPVNGNLPAIPPSQPIADVLEVIDAYAQQHRLGKREIIDLFLRTGAAHLSEGVCHDG